jgi:hypothetical protein
VDSSGFGESSDLKIEGTQKKKNVMTFSDIRTSGIATLPIAKINNKKLGGEQFLNCQLEKNVEGCESLKGQGIGLNANVEKRGMEFEDITFGGVERDVKGLEGSPKEGLKWFGRFLIKGSEKSPKKGKGFVVESMEGK